MNPYRAPIAEVEFVLNHLLDFKRLQDIEEFADASPDLVAAILEQAGKFAEEVFAPLNQIGDQQHSRLVDGGVVTPKGFAAAYRQFVDSGWLSLAQPSAYGGQGLPFIIHMAASEFWNSANMALAVNPMLTAGAIDVVLAHASEALKDEYLPQLVSGEWTGTMNLTESHAGSDLSNLKSRAVADGDHYRLRGQKVFISWGDHDMTDNIVHIVLAPLEGAVAGVKGLSLFLVPKILPGDDGEPVANDVEVVSVEEKMGIHASPTCVLSFGEKQGAVAYMIGKPGRGLACMFTLMNHARLEVGLEGVGLAERAYQDALAYAKERVQGRDTNGQSTTIIGHADVQRMLMQMYALTTAMRGLCYDAAYSHDLRRHANDEAERSWHQQRFALLTPVCKAWCTEVVNEVTSLAIQVYGGMGYVEETGVAQYYRDARITSIYEGTTGIQANDLVGRKLLRDGGEMFARLLQELHMETTDAVDALSLQYYRQAFDELKASADYILENAPKEAKLSGAVGFNFLMQMGYVLGAWYHLRSRLLLEKEDVRAFLGSRNVERKQAANDLYLGQILPRAGAHHLAITRGGIAGAKLHPELW